MGFWGPKKGFLKTGIGNLVFNRKIGDYLGHIQQPPRPLCGCPHLHHSHREIHNRLRWYIIGCLTFLQIATGEID